MGKVKVTFCLIKTNFVREDLQLTTFDYKNVNLKVEKYLTDVTRGQFPPLVAFDWEII